MFVAVFKTGSSLQARSRRWRAQLHGDLFFHRLAIHQVGVIAFTLVLFVREAGLLGRPLVIYSFAAIPVHFLGERKAFVICDHGTDNMSSLPGDHVPLEGLIFHGDDGVAIRAWAEAWARGLPRESRVKPVPVRAMMIEISPPIHRLFMGIESSACIINGLSSDWAISFLTLASISASFFLAASLAWLPGSRGPV